MEKEKGGTQSLPRKNDKIISSEVYTKRNKILTNKILTKYIPFCSYWWQLFLIHQFSTHVDVSKIKHDILICYFSEKKIYVL